METEKISGFESSNVQEIEFFPDLHQAVVTFKDGAIYRFTPVDNVNIGGLRVAHSKGAYIHANFPPGVKVRGSRKEEDQLPADPGLRTYEADDCCGTPIWRALRKGELDNKAEWTCPKCGCKWEPTKQGPIIHWMPRPVLVVIPR
jgi:hypothetical protein